jgi:hypothetical protein
MKDVEKVVLTGEQVAALSTSELVRFMSRDRSYAIERNLDGSIRFIVARPFGKY